MIVDNISSGLDPSASNYISSSSYVNGSLVRSGGNIGEISQNNITTTSRTLSSSAASGTS